MFTLNSPSFFIRLEKEKRRFKMVDNNTIVNVTNRSRGSVGYTIPDMGNLQRHFNYG